ncbi:MAG: hypothetical protein AB1941_13440 [Gemmatimonadota bacterium]
MKRLASLLSLCLLLAAPAAARAQEGGRLVPYGGVTLGRSSLPTQFQTCPPGSRTTADARIGVARGLFALEARFGALADFADMVCLDVVADPAVRPDGVHTHLSYPYGNSDAHLAGDLRLRLGGTRAVPLVVSGGAGWLSPTGVPYLVGAAGVRLGGRVRLAVDVERNWYRVERTLGTAEWRDGRVYRHISLEEQTVWLDGTGVRAGLELAFR